MGNNTGIDAPCCRLWRSTLTVCLLGCCQHLETGTHNFAHPPEPAKWKMKPTLKSGYIEVK